MGYANNRVRRERNRLKGFEMMGMWDREVRKVVSMDGNGQGDIMQEKFSVMSTKEGDENGGVDDAWVRSIIALPYIDRSNTSVGACYSCIT